MSQKQTKKQSKHRVYDFELVLWDLTDLTDDVMDVLPKSGCYDATFSLRYGVVWAEFSREADSYNQAMTMTTAIADVRKARFQLNLVEETGES